jgi:hypothetical protein
MEEYMINIVNYSMYEYNLVNAHHFNLELLSYLQVLEFINTNAQSYVYMSILGGNTCTKSVEYRIDIPIR